jgi:hypothetical protein
MSQRGAVRETLEYTRERLRRAGGCRAADCDG